MNKKLLSLVGTTQVITFIFIGVSAVMSIIMAQESEGTSPENKVQLHYRIQGSSTYHMPIISPVSDIIRPYQTSGLSLSLASPIVYLQTHFQVEVGKIRSKTSPYYSSTTLHASVSWDYDAWRNGLKLYNRPVFIKPALGLSNMLLVTVSKSIGIQDLIKGPFINNENEFGLLFGINTSMTLYESNFKNQKYWYSFKKVSIAIPIRGEIVFSKPYQYISITGSIQVGVDY